MADAPWRCSECGTINEPVANACRTCGRWPSLFDLQESVVDEVEPEFTREPQPTYEPEVEVGDLASEPVPIETPQSEPAEPESPSARGRRIIGSVIVPIAVVVYLVITFIVNR